jgi:flagellar biosynthesis chaperone FliJ
LTNLEKKIDNLAQVIGEMREELKELRKLKEDQQTDQSFLMVSIF